MARYLTRRYPARLPALALVAGVLFLTFVLRPLSGGGFWLAGALIGMGASTLIALAGAVARVYGPEREVRVLSGCASGLLLAPAALFLFGPYTGGYAGIAHAYGLLYCGAALAAGGVYRREIRSWRTFSISAFCAFVPTLGLLCLIWLVNSWDL